MNARSHEGIGADPSFILDHDGKLEKRHRRVAIVMRTRAEMRALGNGDALPDRNRTKRIEDRPISNCGLIANGEIPWDRNADGGIDVHVAADASAEQAEKETPPAPKRPRAPGEERMRERPEQTVRELTLRPLPSGTIRGNIYASLVQRTLI